MAYLGGEKGGGSATGEGMGGACYVLVGENLIDFPKVKCGGILTVRPQVLDGHSKEFSDCSRE
jgi:hypothetical protein